MIKRITIIIFYLLITFTVFAQNKVRVNLLYSKNKSTNIEDIQSDKNGIKIKESISYLDFAETETKEGKYIQFSSQGMTVSYKKGKPNLPLISRLIEIPLNTKPIIKVLNYDEEYINLKDYKLGNEIIPAQPSLSKSDNPNKVPFYKNLEIYSKNEFFKNEIITFEDRGYLRNKHLGYIEISPFEYNPVTNTIKVLNNIEIDIHFVNDNKSKSINTKNSASPYFDNIKLNTINNNNNNSTKALLNGPIKYVIVSDRMFEETLQKFVNWKILKGFNVIEAYTDDPDVGNTTNSIRTYLRNLYDNPSDDISPTFILFVGDIEQVPSFSGTTGSHVTDLYYCEYTDDKLPEVFYGRFSATNIEELQPQIDKTLELEKYEIPDAAYLNNAVLIAGHDTYGNDLIVGNGLVNYASKNYINENNGINSYSYLSPESQNYASEIRDNINNGVSIANYTAHCSSSGWGDPSFTTSNIPAMTNEHMYPLMIGNCCLSNKFDDNACFGESLLRAKDKGAVGYIGASNSSLWDEDFYWGVGLAEKTSNPTYQNSDLGFYDRFFHLNGEEKNDWYITQGQMITAGNLAVESSASANKAYYWEIYHLMGDPSLTPYVTIPQILTASYNSEIVLGASNFQITTEENSYVALSYKGQILDTKLVDESGIVNLSFTSLTNAGVLDLVITKQNRQVIIDQIKINPYIPYIVLDEFEIDDKLENANGQADYNESIRLNVKLKNISDISNAFNVIATLTSIDTNVIITDNTETYGTINKSENISIESAFGVNVKSSFKNQHTAQFNLNITGTDAEGVNYKWNSKLNIKLNAPQLEIKEIYVGNNFEDNNFLVPGTTDDISIIVTNIGDALISDISIIANTLSNSSAYLNFNNSQIANINLDTQQTDTLKFNVTIEPTAPVGTLVYLNFNLNNYPDNYYSQQQNKKLIIGEIPEILISQQGIIQTNYAYFYDTGGKNNNYTKNEDYTITFIPNDINKKLLVNFFSIDIESGTDECYDYLEIYNGENTNAPLIGSYCNANRPKTIKANNENGALTFKFFSDVSVNQAGWEAEIFSFEGFNYQLTVNGVDGPLAGAAVSLNGKTITTGSDGIALFENIIEGIDIPLLVSADGYNEISTAINLLENTTQEISLTKILYNLTFIIKDKFSHIPVENAEIKFIDQTVYSNENGIYIFNNLEPRLNETILVTKDGFENTTNSININNNKTVIINITPTSYKVTFNVFDIDETPLKDVTVTFNLISTKTNSAGIAIFNDIVAAKKMPYILSKSGYSNIIDTTDIIDENVTITKQMDRVSGIIKNKELLIKVYPNPSNGIFNLNISKPQKTDYTIKIYDVLGSLIYSKILKGETKIMEQINISENTKGIFFLKIESNEGLLFNEKLFIK
ncbi:MAG: hypothetical protein JEZ09_05955 [Salinivirgaceae bacterium]|nr:hypothetical protein [Salinivirgaceae bacterium]